MAVSDVRLPSHLQRLPKQKQKQNEKKKLDPILETDKETSNSPARSILRHRALNEGL
jgi:hypothetical protein